LLIQTNGFGSAPRQPGKFTYVQMMLLPDPAPARSLLAVAGCCPGAHGVHAESVSGTATGRKRTKAAVGYWRRDSSFMLGGFRVARPIHRDIVT